MRPEDRLSPLLYAVGNPAPQRSCPTVDEILAKAQFLSPLLYQIHCIGPVGFGFAHTYSEGPPQIWTLKLAPSMGRTCVLVRTIIEQGRAKPPRGNDDGQPAANGELPRGSQLSGRLAPCAWPSPPPGLSRPANLTGGPRWNLVEEHGGRAKRFQGAPRREQFLEVGVGAF